MIYFITINPKENILNKFDSRIKLAIFVGDNLEKLFDCIILDITTNSDSKYFMIDLECSKDIKKIKKYLNYFGNIINIEYNKNSFFQIIYKPKYSEDYENLMNKILKEGNFDIENYNIEQDGTTTIDNMNWEYDENNEEYNKKIISVIKKYADIIESTI